ncbi:hypothetical protein [Leifsonia sp. Leaf264]|uniref:hypothetical protein n=1 Tax=Leifsonia sp. Leaf264 TaxID=1736314 RepID=UPI0012F9CAD5|nr:hypothetical protein [Leifsonia sp. Leaf264]
MVLSLAIAPVAVAVVTWVGVRELLAKEEREQTIPLASDMKAQVVAGESEAAQRPGSQFQAHAAKAASLTSDRSGAPLKTRVG